ncbi:TetR family transcriptional regulator [Sphingopyxis sp. YF1]|jgi:AcrR family transcriptional regulator|uniref:TetR/AcrR family transcriptional regulator n=1 Tax=Sphingopyxis sp. YF1 TaxID=2482763 RepID=UPI001F60EE81|nr:TetR/AcrR family transcriptional regulator [Sphingopyxis sp. YF1]UNU41744.1 TetR family transcriptional regulator [Sphingopyxis sp. YF1]
MDEARSESHAAPETASGVQPKGKKTRERLLDAANDAILYKGFAATSIDELVEAAGISKGGFFYHFRDKGDLARELLQRFLAEDDAEMDALTGRAHALADDPMQRFLIFLDLYADLMDEMEAVHPGCLVAAIIYQEQAFDREVRALLFEAAIRWRERFRLWFAAIEEQHRPLAPIDLDTIADSFSAVIEGSIVLTRALGDHQLMGRQLRLFRSMVQAAYGVS